MADLGLNMTMSVREQALVDNYVTNENKRLNEGRKRSGDNLEMNDFLKILTAQLSHQDPAAPMEDKEFISQMAQISSLKQITNMAGDMAKLATVIGSNEATSALGKNVELVEGDSVVQGIVKAVTRGGEPSVLVNGEYFQWKQVSKVFE
ncbi:MAG: flagellar hook assembly protein FlgD [Spirochaetaceae bacterium]|jgi:flagellar basal-body rod modification protein FlgD|nr:flagellar hook assembly protein FlgD [Spirochaetaceae bacterium]